MGRHRLASKICASARAQPPRVAHGLNSHTACAIGGVESWTSSQERQKGCVKRLTPRAPPEGPKSRRRDFVAFRPGKHTARKLEGLPFRAAIWDRQAVYWWLYLGHELSFQAKSLGSRPRSSNRRAPDLQFHDGPGSDHMRDFIMVLCVLSTVSLRCPGSWRPCCSAHVRRNVP